MTLPAIRNDAEAGAFLESLINYEKLLAGGLNYDTKTFDLENFRALLADLGNPHCRYAAIHVAGTKGKGSTCAFLASVLSRAGLRTGLYTSPHIEHYRERIAIDGGKIPEARFCGLLTHLGERLESQPPGPPGAGFRTVFEILTAAAFLHFAEEKVDVAVIETGLGGRLDSTNVFDEPSTGLAHPLVNIITTNGLDHPAVLGDTVDKIAAEKAGIIRAHAVTVLAPQPLPWRETVRQVVRPKCGRFLDAESLILCAPETADTALFTCAGGSSLAAESRLAGELARGIRLVSVLAGAHQFGNLCTVLAALVGLEIASGGTLRVDSASIRAGVAATRWPGRFEIACREPLVIVDGAHCVLSAEALGDTFRALFGEREVVVVAGFMRDKAARGICDALRTRMRITRAFACAPQSPRAMPANQAAGIMRETLGVSVAVEPEPGRAVRQAMECRNASEAVVVFGSMFLVGPAHAALRGGSE